jgi:hypothetical protein
LVGNPELLGLGFPDLLVGLLLCALLPGLLERARWVVLALDAEAEGSWEHCLLDVAVAMNGGVCRVAVWPWLLVLHDRHARGGLMPSEGSNGDDDVPFWVAVVSALHTLPWRCALGTLVLFAAGVYNLWVDAVQALKHWRPRLDPQSGGRRGGGSSSNDKASRAYGGRSSTNGRSGASSDGGVSPPPPRRRSTLESGSLLDALDQRSGGGDETPNRTTARRWPYPAGGQHTSRASGGVGSNNSSSSSSSAGLAGDAELPAALARRAMSPEDLEWLRAQRRIAAQVKAEKAQQDAEARRSSGSEDDDGGDDGPLEPIPGYYEKDADA